MKVHVDNLAALQREYDACLRAGAEGAALRVGDIISDYEKSEGLRLRAARHRDSQTPEVRLV